MPKEMIVKIQKAEAEAQAIRLNATEEAKDRVRKAEAAGQQLCREAEAKTARENEEKLRMTRQRAEEFLSHSREEAEEQAAQLMKEREPYLRDSVRMIVGGVFEQCQ